MKKINKILISSIVVFLLSNNISFARILRCNNTGISLTPVAPNTNPIYTTAQAAHDAAINGDTIHIEPSGVSYGDLNISKQLVIIGNGFFLGPTASNFNPNLQANTNASIVGNINFIAGSSNSTLTGITINNSTNLAQDASTLNNITLKRNYFIGGFFAYGNVSNTKVIQNYFNNLAYAFGSFTTFLLTNNIMARGIQFDANDNGIVENNIIGFLGFGDALVLQNCTIRNNIDCSGGSANFTGSTVQNNMSASTLFGNLDGNLQNINMTNVFEDFANTSPTFSTDSRFQLKTGSPAIGAGFGGVNMGAFGGSFPYVISGIPNVPAIFKLNTPSTVTSNSMSVTISTRSNN